MVMKQTKRQQKRNAPTSTSTSRQNWRAPLHTVYMCVCKTSLNFLNSNFPAAIWLFHFPMPLRLRFFIFASTTDCTILFDFLLVWRWVALLLILLLLNLPTVSVCVWPRRAGARTSLIARLFPSVARAKSTKINRKIFPFSAAHIKTTRQHGGRTNGNEWRPQGKTIN